MVETTVQEACNILIDILITNGIKDAVLSPGSRNAPLIMAFARIGAISKKVVVDERSAAFMALGIAKETQRPVVIVCTSGTALLNYSPAIAEAYYQQIPLIVISADRPSEWIDQDDSQTIRQNGALANFVKSTYDIPAYYEDENLKWFINRSLNDAILNATTNNQGPVHINFHIAEPLCESSVRMSNLTRRIESISPDQILSDKEIDRLALEYTKAKKVMIVGGFESPDNNLRESIVALSTLPNTVVLTETITNICGGEVIPTIDRLISQLKSGQFKDFQPDLLITFGGSLVTRILKEKLRQFNAPSHWHVGTSEHVIDTMKSLTCKINIQPRYFFPQLKSRIGECSGIYNDQWQHLSAEAKVSHQQYVDKSPWCDLKAFDVILGSIPDNTNLHISNGTAIRYAQLFGDKIKCKCSCNRGTAGIDGSTSTALGASLVSEHNTIFISGDMSFTYDLGALASQYKNPKFKIIVMCNGGGGIFRFLKGTSKLPELENYFEVHHQINIKAIATSFDYKYFGAGNLEELIDILPTFYNSDDTAILAVHTPRELNAEILRGYFKRNKI